tara:strand:+ start:385 stop:570 length:186 start_codon:yes stop_codon:yes gene_type:complete
MDPVFRLRNFAVRFEIHVPEAIHESFSHNFAIRVKILLPAEGQSKELEHFSFLCYERNFLT